MQMPQNYEQPIEPLPVRYGWSGGEGCRALMLSLQPSPRVQQPGSPPGPIFQEFCSGVSTVGRD